MRVTVETDDGALILVTYGGRTVVADSPGKAPLYVTPVFSTGDERYSFLNELQVVGKEVLNDDLSQLVYDVYELR